MSMNTSQNKVTFTHSKILLYEDWLSIAAFAYDMMMGDHIHIPKPELLEEIEKAHFEHMKWKEQNECCKSSKCVSKGN